MPSQTDDLIEPEPTGNVLVRFNPDASTAEMTAALQSVGLDAIASTADLGPEAKGLVSEDADAVLIAPFNMGVVRAKGDLSVAQMLNNASGVVRARPEFYMYPLDWARRRQTWVREGLHLLADYAEVDSGAATALHVAAESDVTWGVEAVGAAASKLTGAGIRVAVLDTGIDARHPDFAGRVAFSADFTGGADPSDRQGHGTHVAGTVCGPATPAGGRPRYGVAPGAELYVYKVLNNQGRGEEGRIIEAMAAAVTAKCVVLNMSLGRPAGRGAQASEDYENIGAKALLAGSLVVAAAGNESARDHGFIAPVGYPANSKSIMAVAAVDALSQVATFSCGGVNPNGGEVDLAGPGVDVFSATILARGGYASLQGTSMAAPHVAGVACLLAEQHPNVRGRALFDLVLRKAKGIAAGQKRDVGVGLASC
jgi:subtilisin